MDDSSETYLCINNPNSNRAVHCSESPLEEEVEKFRRKLKYFFMNPCDKYKARRRKPWKLILQIVKIAVVTIQLVSFGLSNQMVVQFKEENLMVFRHLFLKNFTKSSANIYAVYTQHDVYTHIAYTVEQFLMLPSITVGNHDYEKEGDVYTPLTICQQFYHNGSISPANETFDIDAQVDEECSLIYPLHPFSSLTADPLNFTLHFERLLTVTVKFTLKAINLETVQYHELPDCYIFNIMITYNNKPHSGRMVIDLDNDVHIYKCRDWTVTGACQRNMYIMVLFDAVVILILALSLLLCMRSVTAGVLLQFGLKNISQSFTRSSRKRLALWLVNHCHDVPCERRAAARSSNFPQSTGAAFCQETGVTTADYELPAEYTAFFSSRFSKRVSFSDRMQFINGWCILIIVSDVLTITGSLLKIIIQLKAVASYDLCSILLGTGTMLVWIGVLRYMGYLRKYNILIITLRAAFPNVIRFTCCAAMIYLGYCFCGWIVLGPYHSKAGIRQASINVWICTAESDFMQFRTLNLVSESLFSLINGDDMFATFKNMQQKNFVVWLFSRLYLYSFVSLFIYMVLSLFITLITDTYDTIKHQQLDGEPVSDLQAFIMQCKDPPESGCFSENETRGRCLMCCSHR
ncbi:Mucolipin-3 [Anabarilius grahami]|uniref:Mucolipin-3 n=1 Tax=Anabarilius grahami TaxID=495550 RepID=A0A3N0Y132_ANAGA|nr:Mucolipin-3 [Anabarilius grahami]